MGVVEKRISGRVEDPFCFLSLLSLLIGEIKAVFYCFVNCCWINSFWEYNLLLYYSQKVVVVGNIVVQEFKLGGCCHWPFLSSVTMSHWKGHFPACCQGKKEATARKVSLSRQMTTVHPLILHVLAVGQNTRSAAVEDGPWRTQNHHRLERWVKETLVTSLLA